MAGGAALNIFNMKAGNLPKEALNWRLWFAVAAFGLMGAARGVDEGLITGVFNSHSFKRQVGIDNLDPVALASIKGNVSSMVQLGSIPGALLCVPNSHPCSCALTNIFALGLSSSVIVSVAFGPLANFAPFGSSVLPSLWATMAAWVPFTPVA